MVNRAEVERQLARERKQRQRAREKMELRQRLAVTHDHVTPEPSKALVVPEPVEVVTPEVVTPREIQIPSAGDFTGSVPLMTLACGVFTVGLVNNVWFAQSQGDTPASAVIFAALTVVNDGAAFFLPDQVKRLWSGRCYIRCVIALMLLVFTLGFALNNSLGFASLNIGNVTTLRAERRSAGVELAERNLDMLSRSREAECKRRGPLCRDLEAREQLAVAALRTERDKIAAQADPQVVQASALVQWISVGRIAPTADDFAMLRLALLTVLPQIGGLLLMVARR